MATNGESARQWLAEHGQTTSTERITQIRQNIEARLTRLPEEREETKGLLEALDVIDSFIISKNSMTEEATPESDTALDYSPLIPQDEPEQPILSATEKQARFQQLLQQAQKNGSK